MLKVSPPIFTVHRSQRQWWNEQTCVPAACCFYSSSPAEDPPWPSHLFLLTLSQQIWNWTCHTNKQLGCGGEIETDRKCGDCTIFKYVCVEEREGWQVCPSVRGLGWYQRCWLWRQHLLIKHRNCHHHHYYSFSQPPSLQTWLHIAVCNGLHAKSTSLSSSDSMWFECMELYPVNCAISTGIFADLCLERTAQCLQGSGCQYDYESASYLIYLFFILDYRTAELQ